MHLVNTNLLAELVKLAEKSRKEVDYLLRFVIFGELRETYHVGIEESNVFERVYHTLVVQDACQDVLRYQFA